MESCICICFSLKTPGNNLAFCPACRKDFYGGFTGRHFVKIKNLSEIDCKIIFSTECSTVHFQIKRNFGNFYFSAKMASLYCLAAIVNYVWLQNNFNFPPLFFLKGMV